MSDRAECIRDGANVRRAIAVGWLDDGHIFPTLIPNFDLVFRLFPLVWRCRALQTRGIHQCSICLALGHVDPENKVRFPNPVSGVMTLGSAELWIPDMMGNVWVAPDLIIHYVSYHAYAPPAPFWRAVEGFRGSHLWDADQIAADFGCKW